MSLQDEIKNVSPTVEETNKKYSEPNLIIVEKPIEKELVSNGNGESNNGFSDEPNNSDKPSLDSNQQIADSITEPISEPTTQLHTNSTEQIADSVEQQTNSECLNIEKPPEEQTTEAENHNATNDLVDTNLTEASMDEQPQEVTEPNIEPTNNESNSEENQSEMIVNTLPSAEDSNLINETSSDEPKQTTNQTSTEEITNQTSIEAVTETTNETTNEILQPPPAELELNEAPTNDPVVDHQESPPEEVKTVEENN